MKTKKFIIFLTTLTVLLSACSPVQTKADIADRPIDIVATTGMIGNAVEIIGGERVNVSTLMGPGVDPHLFKASESNVNQMANADIIFYNGLSLELQMENVFEQMQTRTTTVAIASAITETVLLADEAYEGQPDPHIWFDISLWIQAVELIRDTLIELDPDSQALYQDNASAYLSELEELHQYVLEQAQRIPDDQRVLITAHDAFQYFGNAYGFEVHGLQGLSTESEASTADVRELVDFIVEQKIKAIFIETSVPERNIQAVQAAAQARGHQVSIGGELYSDAMGSPGTPEGTYLGMVRHNIDTIVSALLSD